MTTIQEAGRRWGLGWLLAVLVAGAACADEPSHDFERPDVLGTSFRLQIVGLERRAAERCEAAALAEIERLGKVLGWGAESELSRLDRALSAGRRVALSPDLARVLRLGLLWRKLTRGAFDPYSGALYALWERAVDEDRLPAGPALEGWLREARRGEGYRLQARGEGQELVCQRAGQLDLQGVVKGYVLDRAMAAIHAREAPRGARLELGSDLLTRGSPAGGGPWRVRLAGAGSEPTGAATLSLEAGAVATCSGYAQPLQVEGRTYSQILDPRTGRPAASSVRHATVVARDAATADALSLVLCVLEPAEGVELARRLMAECCLVDASGKLHRSGGWGELDAAPAWRPGDRVEVSFRLVDSTRRRRFKRHGVAVWVEDSAGERVRILALWFDRGEMKYVKRLPAFWRAWREGGGEDRTRALRPWTRATRAPGAYTLAWDGKDEQGRRCPPGRYRIRIDVNREHGPQRERHSEASIELRCGGEPDEGSAEDQPELREVRARFGPASGRGARR